MANWIKQTFPLKYFKYVKDWIDINYIDWSNQQLWPNNTRNCWVNTNGLDTNKYYLCFIQITSANNYETIWCMKKNDTTLRIGWITSTDKFPDDYITGYADYPINSAGWSNAGSGNNYIYRYKSSITKGLPKSVTTFYNINLIVNGKEYSDSVSNSATWNLNGTWTIKGHGNEDQTILAGIKDSTNYKWFISDKVIYYSENGVARQIGTAPQHDWTFICDINLAGITITELNQTDKGWTLA